MSVPLMPKATAVWLISNTTLTFDQVADFCKLHPLEVQGIADGDVASGILGEDPVINGQLTREEIKRCEQDPKAKLELIQMNYLKRIFHVAASTSNCATLLEVGVLPIIDEIEARITEVPISCGEFE